MKALKVVVFSAMLTLAAATAEAYPILQLDTLGGLHDASTETIVSDGRPDFTLVALLTPQGNHSALELLGDVYYTAAAVSPNRGPATTGLSYFATFNVTTALAGSNTLHFDLYNTAIRVCGRNRGCLLDLDAGLNVPFSQDAESSNHKVAEPGSMLLMSLGLLFAARSLRRMKKTK